MSLKDTYKSIFFNIQEKKKRRRKNNCNNRRAILLLLRLTFSFIKFVWRGDRGSHYKALKQFNDKHFMLLMFFFTFVFTYIFTLTKRIFSQSYHFLKYSWQGFNPKIHYLPPSFRHATGIYVWSERERTSEIFFFLLLFNVAVFGIQAFIVRDSFHIQNQLIFFSQLFQVINSFFSPSFV